MNEVTRVSVGNKLLHILYRTQASDPDNINLPLNESASAAKSGASPRQIAHHGAQNQRTAGFPTNSCPLKFPPLTVLALKEYAGEFDFETFKYEVASDGDIDSAASARISPTVTKDLFPDKFFIDELQSCLVISVCVSPLLWFSGNG
jgi:hypothetical protein